MKVLKIINFALVFIVAVSSVPGTALSSGLVVLYPEVRKPYAKIYEDIVAGIKEVNQTTTQVIAVDPNQPIDQYKASLAISEPDTIIALGEYNLTLVQEMNLSVPLVVGGISHATTKVRGISMIPDARVAIDKLMLLSGDVRSIHTVTNAQNRKHQLGIASDYAASKGIDLIVHDVDTLQAAANEYRTLLVDIEEHDAIWLMRDKALNDSAVLSGILQTAWSKRIAVFSSNPTHVKRGALFAIYPNNKKLGASLAILAADTSQSAQPPSLSPLRDVFTVVNGRTSRHLGVKMSSEVRAAIDSIF